MKKTIIISSIIAAVALAVVMALGAFAEPDMPTPPYRFNISEQPTGSYVNNVYIITDSDTGMQYLYVLNIYGGSGLTKLLQQEEVG